MYHHPMSFVNTAYPQKKENRYQLKTKQRYGEKSSREVWQDKRASVRARAASAQAYRAGEVVRADKSTRIFLRSQITNSIGKPRVHVDVHVKPVVKAELQRIAKAEGVSVSAVGEALIERALQGYIDMQYGALLTPVIRSALAAERKKDRDRFAALMVRVAADAGQTKHVVANILANLERGRPLMEKELTRIVYQSKKLARESIMRRTEETDALIRAVGKWLDGEAEAEKTGQV